METRQAGHTIQKTAELAGCSASQVKRIWAKHINMLGRYSFSVPDAVAKGELRALRNPSDEE